jgi:hypothetical protein
MVAATFGDDTVNMGAVGRNQTTDIISGEEKDTLDAILLLGLEGKTALALKEGTGSPSGTPKDTGGIGGGGHGVEILIELGRVDLLGLIDGEEQVGGGTHDFGVGLTGKELQAGVTKRVHVALGSMPAAARADTGIEGTADAIHVVGGLGFEGGGDGDNAPANLRGPKKKPGKEVSLEFVLAGLARKDDDKGETQVVKDGFSDGKGNEALVGAEVDATGRSPTDWVAADGGANPEGEGLRIYD